VSLAKSATLAPRVVVVSRRSELDGLLAQQGTRAAAGYYQRERGRDLGEVDGRHIAQQRALIEVGASIPPDWRRGHLDRDDLPRFLFAPEDVIVAVGQDGLVANVAKYLAGQPVIGIDPEPDRNPGVLVRHSYRDTARLLVAAVAGTAAMQRRTMVRALVDDGQELVGLNEVYFGHPTHQSARYLISTPDGARERQSSSGVVIGTGTGATGWCASIARERPHPPTLPGPEEPSLTWFVREAWPSPSTGVTLTAGRLAGGEQLELIVEGERHVLFADGLESDHIPLLWGQRVTIGLAARHLNLVVGA
jgi:hypothetical protein